MKIDYGLKMLPDTILHNVYLDEFCWYYQKLWLDQPELKAIKDGLTYVED
jgi:hypothetical protein